MKKNRQLAYSDKEPQPDVVKTTKVEWGMVLGVVLVIAFFIVGLVIISTA